MKYSRFFLVFAWVGLVSMPTFAQVTEGSLKVFNYTYSYTTAGGASVTRTIPTKIYLPTPGTYDPLIPLPVVMYLHGAGERGNGIDVDGSAGIDPWAFSDSLQLIDRSAIYVAPRGIKDFLATDAEYIENFARYGSDYASYGEYWVNNYGTSDEYDYRNFPLSASLRGAMSLTDTLLTSPTLTNLVDSTSFSVPLVDPRRQYVVGWSAGGDGVWDAVTRQPHKYAAAIPVSGVGDPGAFGSHLVPGLLSQPLRAFAGGSDHPDQQSALLKMQTAMSGAGAAGTAQLLPGENHFTISSAVFGDINNRNWLYSQTADAAPEPTTLALCVLGLFPLLRRHKP